MRAKVVKASERSVQTGQTSGMVREEAFHSDKTWAGVAHNAPKAFSGWHHHGDYESVIFVLSGHVRIECGPGGGTCEIHREGNPTDATTEVVLVRAGQGEVVVNVDGPA